eukprot:997387-Rhodomonas_salina.1
MQGLQCLQLHVVALLHPVFAGSAHQLRSCQKCPVRHTPPPRAPCTPLRGDRRLLQDDFRSVDVAGARGRRASEAVRYEYPPEAKHVCEAPDDTTETQCMFPTGLLLSPW